MRDGHDGAPSPKVVAVAKGHMEGTQARRRIASSRGPWLLASASAAVLTLALAGASAISRRDTPSEPITEAPLAVTSSLPGVALGPPPSGWTAHDEGAAPLVVTSAPPQLQLLLPGPAEEPPPLPLLKPQAAFSQNLANRAMPRLGDQAWKISDPWRAQHERQLRFTNRATAKLVFLGDSITEGWGVAPSYKEQLGKYSPLNLGVVGDTTQNVIWRVTHGALDGTRPELVVVMIGVNNLAGGFTPEATADGVRAVVSVTQSRLPEARVLLLAVLPARQHPSSPLRERIRQANRLIAGLASAGKVEFLDVGSVLLEPDGSISKAVLRDFLHPTVDGFEKLTRAVAPRIDALLGSSAPLPAQ